MECAAEGDAQTNRYYTDAAREGVRKHFELNEDTQFHFIYLTLDTTVTPSEKRYAQVFYQQFLQDEWPLNDATLHQIFGDFQQTLQQFYSPLENPMQTLSTDVELLDQTQKIICWQSILFEKFRNKPQFLLNWGNTVGRGRDNFVFLVWKSNWHSKSSYEETGLVIHVDTYINLLSNQQYIQKIDVRYETNPYKPNKHIEHKEGYNVFRNNKKEFAERLYEKAKQLNINAKKRTIICLY